MSSASTMPSMSVCNVSPRRPTSPANVGPRWTRRQDVDGLSGPLWTGGHNLERQGLSLLRGRLRLMLDPFQDLRTAEADHTAEAIRRNPPLACSYIHPLARDPEELRDLPDPDERLDRHPEPPRPNLDDTTIWNLVTERNVTPPHHLDFLSHSAHSWTGRHRLDGRTLLSMPTETPLLTAKTVGEALTLLRARADLNRDDLARDAEVATGTLSRYERDKTQKPDAQVLRRLVTHLAEATGADARMLWREIGDLMDRQQASTRYVRAQVRSRQRGRRKARA
jgi:transcriptional regulator with XRE-family HTH domain